MRRKSLLAVSVSCEFVTSIPFFLNEPLNIQECCGFLKHFDFYRLKSKISNGRKTAIFAMSTLLNMIGPGFIYGLPLIYVELIHDLNVSRAEAALLISTTRGVTFGAGITLKTYYIRSNCCQRLPLIYVRLIHHLNM